MKHDIPKHSAPKMPTLGNGTECIKLLLSQTSKDMHEPLVPMLFPALGAHVSVADFQHRPHLEGTLWPNWRPKVRISRVNCPLL